MNRGTSHQPDYLLWLLIVVLVLFGLVMLSSAGAVLGFQRFHDSNYFLKKQALSVLIGAIAFAVTYRFDYHRLRRWAFPLVLGTLILLVLVFLPGIGSYYLGARRWIHLGPLPFQPSELAKLTFILYLATWFERRMHKVKDLQEGFIPFLSSMGLLALLIMAEPDLGTTIIILLISLVVFFLAGASWKHLLGLIAVGALGIVMLIAVAPYRAQRFTVFLNPALDPQGIGYHINQALLGIGSGGWFGLGLGHSQQKFNYLPEPAGDSIFAVTAEELGFVFMALFIIGWLVFIIRGFRIARDAPDDFSRLVAAGITAWLGFQAFLNIGALSGLLPLTGIPLPFMSNGGSAMIINLTAVGILLNISRHTIRSTSPRR